MKMSKGWGSRTRTLVMVAVAVGALLACGSKTAPPAQSGTAATDGTPATATSWGDLCKLANTRVKRCNVTNPAVAQCDSLSKCATDLFDPSAIPVLSSCLTDPDCKACGTVLRSSTPDGKSYLDLIDPAKNQKCPMAGGGFAGELSGLFKPAVLAPFLACVKKDCSESMGCTMQAMSSSSASDIIDSCQETLGLQRANPGEADATQQGSAPDPVSQTAAPDPTGQPAPEISATALGKIAVPKIKSLKGKIVILHFWASWCEPCKKTMPMLDTFAKKNKSKVVVIGISVDDDQASAEKFVASVKVKFPNAFDAAKKTAADYTLATMPSTVIIDKNGNVSKIIAGSNANFAADLKSAL